MKITVILISIVCITLVQTQKLQGQENVTKPQQAENQVTPQQADNHVKLQQADSTAKKETDVMVNMEMIESFRRCYDKIEVIDWASILNDASSDELKATFIAFCRMQKTEDVNINTKTLVAETEKVKIEVASNTPVMLKSTEEKEVIAATDLEISTTNPK